jgi:signal transduction histidine kinase
MADATTPLGDVSADWPEGRWRGGARFAFAIFCLATLMALLSVLEGALLLSREGQSVELGWLLTDRLSDWYSCAVFVPALYWLTTRHPIERRTWLRALPLHLAASLAGTFLKFVLLLTATPLLGEEGFDLTAEVAGDLLGSLMFFWAVIGLLHAVFFYRRAQARETTAASLRSQLADAKLQVLRSQLHPHFLFNTLNAVTTLISRDPRAAEEMITGLAELLRESLRSTSRHEVTLKEELVLLERYLAIMQVRYAERLTVAYDLDPSLLDALVPQFILQPLVENALEHGVSSESAEVKVIVQAARTLGGMQLAIDDNGPGIGARTRSGHGVGLSNTRSRLEELHGPRASVSLESLPDGGARIEVRLPIVTQRAAA